MVKYVIGNKNYLWLLPAFITVTAAFFQFIDATDEKLFDYHRAGVLSGQYWRLLSAHFTHLGWPHLALNMSAFLLFWLIFKETFSLRCWLAIILLCSIGISISFVLFDPGLDRYVGFSGVLHGLFIAAAIKVLIQNSRSKSKPLSWEAAVILVGVLAKVAYEQILGPVPMTQKASGGNVIVNAHLYGTIIGTLSACLALMRQRIS